MCRFLLFEEVRTEEARWRDAQRDGTKANVVTEAEQCIEYGQNGVVTIDLDRVGSQVVDLTGGIPGHVPCRMCNWSIKDQEVLIQGGVPRDAIVG